MSLEVDADVTRGGFRLRVTLTVESGETVAILGPNGAGKTTLLHVIAGLCALDRGRVECDGDLLDDGERSFVLPEARRFGCVFQDRRLFPYLSVLDNVAFGLRTRGVDRPTARGRAERELESVGAYEYRTMRPRELSGGQAQRVALARTLVTEPRVLLLDEPFDALDAAARPAMRALLADRLEASETSTLLVTHDEHDASVLASRAIRLDAGEITGSGPPAPGAKT